ncbi:triple QxxK/R motif-containing protein [Lates japonicus]|uniref:Triple QxxK/R motif-containing protein n=1 Tax=Lates japonicus TaxID=270547 RepID=A0AAD3NG57_LATJO|nr:triple QxxK/R motif-containing protein [Lates japonicus]
METPGWGPSTSSSSSCGSLSTSGSCSTLGMLGAGSLSPWRQATAQQTSPHLVRLLFSSWDAFLVIAAILFFVLCVYAFFYLNLSTEINLDVDVD